LLAYWGNRKSPIKGIVKEKKPSRRLDADLFFSIQPNRLNAASATAPPGLDRARNLVQQFPRLVLSALGQEILRTSWRKSRKTSSCW